MLLILTHHIEMTDIYDFSVKNNSADQRTETVWGKIFKDGCFIMKSQYFFQVIRMHVFMRIVPGLCKKILAFRRNVNLRKHLCRNNFRISSRFDFHIKHALIMCCQSGRNLIKLILIYLHTVIHLSTFSSWTIHHFWCIVLVVHFVFIFFCTLYTENHFLTILL